MNGERVVELDLGCYPEAGVSGALLLQSENLAILLFNAMSTAPDTAGRHSPLGTGIVEFVGLHQIRFGGPNDEGRPEHPLYAKGICDIIYGICEVLNSCWARDEAMRTEGAARRIHRDRFAKTYAN